jgi:tetratricopeptide (TPR) repeat protein
MEFLEMTMGLIHYFGVRGLLNERISRSQQGLHAARRIHDIVAEAWLLVAGFGWTYIQQGLLDSALAIVHEGCKIAEQHGIQTCMAEAYRHLGVIYLEQQNYGDAALQLSNALKAATIPRIQARIYSDLGRLAERTKDYQRAKAEYQTSLEISLQSNDYWGKLTTPLYLAELEFMKLDYAEATRYYDQALILGESVRAHWIIAEAKFGLARIKIEQRCFSHARDLLEVSIKAFEELGMLDRKTEAVELLRTLP